MLTVLFAILAVVCGVGWFVRYVSCAALVYYMKKNQYRLPDSEGMKECTDFVVKNIFKL